MLRSIDLQYLQVGNVCDQHWSSNRSQELLEHSISTEQIKGRQVE